MKLKFPQSKGHNPARGGDKLRLGAKTCICNKRYSLFITAGKELKQFNNRRTNILIRKWAKKLTKDISKIDREVAVNIGKMLHQVH